MLITGARFFIVADKGVSIWKKVRKVTNKCRRNHRIIKDPCKNHQWTLVDKDLRKNSISVQSQTHLLAVRTQIITLQWKILTYTTLIKLPKSIPPIVGPINNMCVHIMHKGELSITSVVFLPQVRNLNVIMKKCQTKHLPSK